MFFNSKNKNDWSHGSNDELWKALQEGNRAALSELFHRFYPRLFRYGLRLISEREAVKDGIQELFLSIWRHREGLETADSVEFYLLLSFRRTLLNQKKKVSNRKKRNFEYSEDLIEYEFNIENQIIHFETNEERYKLYQKALNTLTDRQRESLQLRLEYGLDNREIASVLEISEKSVRNLIYESTKKLKDWIESRKPVKISTN
jgi:RNA polymerase sigma-70 factor (ECF subfamily)